MSKRKKILTTTDLSTKSDLAVDKAIALAAKHDMWLEVLHVIGLPLFEMFFGEQYEHRIGKESEVEKEKLKEISEKIREKLHRTGEKINLDVKFGNPAEEIVEYAEHKHADLIVLGSSGEYTKVAEFVLGTTVKNVIDTAKCPVLVVKNEKNIESYKKITLIVDYSELSADMVRFAAEFFADANISLVSVCELPSEFRLKYYGLKDAEIDAFIETQKKRCKIELDSFIDSLGVDKGRIDSVLVDGSLNAAKAIEVAKESGAGLIGVSTAHIDDYLSKIIGNLAADVMEKADIDTLVYRA